MGCLAREGRKNFAPPAARRRYNVRAAAIVGLTPHNSHNSYGANNSMIIQRAFVGETLRLGGAVGVVLLGIFLLVRMLGFLRQAAAGDIPAGGVLLLLLFKTIAYLDLLLPLALYIAALLALARMRRANELVMLDACGLGLAALIKPALQLGVIIGALTAFCSLYLAPLSVAAGRLQTAELRQQSETGGVQAGRFMATRAGDGVYFVERYNAAADALRNLFVYEGGAPADENAARITVAESGRRAADEHTDATFLVLQNGARYHIAAGRADYTAIQFAEYGLALPPPGPPSRRVTLSAMPTPDLWRAQTPAAIGEFHWRIAKAAMPAVLLLFAIALATGAPGGRRASTMVAALLVYFMYANLLGFAQAQIARGAAPAILWLLHGAFLFGAIYLLWRRARGQSPWPGRPPRLV